jgi:hypothetical protein
LEDCFRIFSCFLSRLRSALDENGRRKESELRQEQRRLSGSRVSLHQTERHLTAMTGNEADVHRPNADRSTVDKTNADWMTHSLPRHRRSLRGRVDPLNGTDQVDSQLLELLNQSSVGQSADNLMFVGGSFRRLGSSRRSTRTSTSATLTNAFPVDSRERNEASAMLTCNSRNVSSSCASLVFDSGRETKKSSNEIVALKELDRSDTNIAASVRLADSFNRFSRMRRSIRGSPLASPTGSKTTLRTVHGNGTGSQNGSTGSLALSGVTSVLQRDGTRLSVQDSTNGSISGGSTSNLMTSSRLAPSSHSSQLSIGTVIAAASSVANRTNSHSNICNENSSSYALKSGGDEQSPSAAESAARLQRQSTFVGGSLLTGLKHSLAQLLPKDSKEKPPRAPSLKHVKARVHSIRSTSIDRRVDQSGPSKPMSSERASSCKAPEVRNRARATIKCDTSSMSQLDGQMRLQLQSLAPATRTTLNRTSLLRMSLNSRLNGTSTPNSSNAFGTIDRSSRSSIRTIRSSVDR